MMEDHFGEWDDLFPHIEDSFRLGDLTMQHTDECLQAQAAREAERAAYVAQWPHYCWVCDGTGQIVDEFDPSPAGVGLSAGTLTSVDPCDVCVGFRVCPRCGKRGLDVEGNGPCTACGFNFTDGLPEAFECTCFDEVFYDGREPIVLPEEYLEVEF